MSASTMVPEVSVIIPCHRSVPTTGLRLEQLNSQGMPRTSRYS